MRVRGPVRSGVEQRPLLRAVSWLRHSWPFLSAIAQVQTRQRPIEALFVTWTHRWDS